MSLLAPWLLLALLTFVGDEPMLRVPEGWRHERFALPPEFAPETAWKGVEDLSFAPGMFENDAPDWFSYGMALAFDGDVELDGPALERFFLAYYRGLAREVAKGKSFTVDTDSATASFERDGERFRGRIATFDVFTDGRPLRLALEVDVHHTPDRTELLALASPAAKDAPIWKELHALGSEWRAARPFEVFLNHPYVVVDRATWDALAHSEWLRASFAAVEERTTKRADASYTGLYFYGRDTYVEVLRDGEAGFSAGRCGVVLGVDRVGALDGVAKRFADAKLNVFPVERTRELDGAQVPWFHMLGLEMPTSGLDVLVMEYDARFLAGWHAELAPQVHASQAPEGSSRAAAKEAAAPASSSVARRDVLARYAAAAKLGSERVTRPFQDVGAVVVPVTDAQRERLAAVARAAGWSVEDVPGTAATRCRGPRIELVLKRGSETERAVEFEFALAQPVEHAPMRFGKAELTFSGRLARLSVDR